MNDNTHSAFVHVVHAREIPPRPAPQFTTATALALPAWAMPRVLVPESEIRGRLVAIANMKAEQEPKPSRT